MAALLSQRASLIERLKSARSVESSTTQWIIETKRVARVQLKHARGHAAYDMNETRLEHL
jgi:hypothetical protein